MEKIAMTRLGILSAAAILSVIAATPAFAIDQFSLWYPSEGAYPAANVASATASVPFGKSKSLCSTCTDAAARYARSATQARVLIATGIGASARRDINHAELSL